MAHPPEDGRHKSSWDDALANQPVEHWDDDDFAGLDDIQFRTASTASSAASWQHHSQQHSHHLDRRDSILSRLSARSDKGSQFDEQDWDLPADQPIDDVVVAAVKSTGIPIPVNVPQSALVGGTIRKMPGKKIKQAMADDWSEDLNFDGPLKLKPHQPSLSSPPPPKSNMLDSDGFDDDFELPTDGMLKPRQVPLKVQPPTPKKKPVDDDFETDFELPKDGLLKRRQPSTPFTGMHQMDDMDIEWAEGSLGTRNAGTRRDGRSARSSSNSAFSPSMSSAITESEDEGLDGLVLPTGPLKFDEILKKRQENQSPEASNFSGDRNAAKRAAAKDDFFSGIEIGDGDVFNNGSLRLNRNVKTKNQRTTSPVRRPATTLTFTSNKPQPSNSRLPRFQPAHDRARPKLEPVSESGSAVSQYRRPESRMTGHTATSSISSIPVPSTPSAPSTPSRRGLRNQESHEQVSYNVPTTTSTQLLKAKRSMPALRNLNSPGKPPPYARPPSRNNDGIPSRLHLSSRPKTPDRTESRFEARAESRVESRIGEARKPAAPFLPAGASAGQSQHVSIKSTTQRHFRRNDSDGSNDGSLAGFRPQSRFAPRLDIPGRRGSLTPAELAPFAKKTITKPTKRRNFGDGNELDCIDDLPTSAKQEQKFVKEPVGRGPPRGFGSLRSKLGFSHLNSSTSTLTTRGGAETPLPTTPLSPNKPDLNVPRFARDTAASRSAREQRQISNTYAPREYQRNPLTPINDNWKTSIAPAITTKALAIPKRGHHKKTQQRPHLIKPIGNHHANPKNEKGMQYNPETFRWEGNENELEPFEVPAFHPPDSPTGSPSGKPPALITNVGQSGGVQVVGEMVFDPRRMCWLKMAPTKGQEQYNNAGSRSGGVSSVQLEDEEDVFAGLEDLKEEDERSSFGVREVRNVSGVSGETGGAGSGDEFVLGEEFDVGPEFIRRQRVEEERWKRKVDGWLRGENDKDDGWRWAIREMLSSAAT